MFLTDTSLLQKKVRVGAGGATRKSRRSSERDKAFENSWSIGWQLNTSKSGIDNVLRWNLELGRVLYRFSRRIQPSRLYYSIHKIQRQKQRMQLRHS
ncbi:MAG: hypothetical protein CLLPBCKN_007110 [Chroococcidiopsis cubana SAG 39.79]|nr:hypothetical protein [Chroococcidiopsis cubana SAG 39.79]